MGFVEAVQVCFQKYFDFNGRARRSELWYFVLFIFIVSIVLSLIDMMIFGTPTGEGFFETPLSDLFSLATFFPSIAVTSRRLHDIDKSGWLQAIPIVPALLLVVMMGSGSTALGGIGMILALVTLALFVLLIVWLATDTHAGENRFGASPK